MASTSQLFLLADHVKLSLLERQRAVDLKLPATTQDAEIGRSLRTLREGLDALESAPSPSPDAARLRQQYNELLRQFDGPDSRSNAASAVLTTPNDAALASDFSSAQRPPAVRTPSKAVRFTDDPSAATDPSRAALLPYSDNPADDATPDHTDLSNTQIHAYHSQVLREQDGQLDVLGRSIGRQRELSIAIGDELDEQVGMLDEVDEQVDRHQSQLDRARGRLGKIARKAKDNLALTTIFALVVVLIFLILILK